ncbi:MAG: nitrogenase component 1 [Candidatus Methanospirareceae archaeon]
MKLQDVLRSVFRDRVFNGIYQGTVWQLHRYGINCKLSGSVYAVSEIEGAIPLIHGPKGCAFHQRLTPRRIYISIQDMPCTCLDENAVIYGGEERLRKGIIDTYNRYKPDLIAVLPTCVAGLIGDDIEGVIQEVKAKVPCDILYVPSEGFAHRDRRALDIFLRDFAKAWKDPTKVPAYEIRGCGYEEVMLALVDQIMDDRYDESADNLVNIETFGRFSYGFERELKEIASLLGKIGVGINTTLLSCTVDEIKRAPAARLNIVRRGIRWAERMKKEFDTDYLRRWFFYTGIDGTEKFLLDVASKLDLDGEAEEVVRIEKERALQELDRYCKTFKNYDFALFTLGFFFTPYSVKTYALDFKIPLKYVCVDTRWMRSHNVSDETIERMIMSMEELIDAWDIGVELIVDPKLNELKGIAKEVDYVLGELSATPIYEKEGISMINTSIGMYLFNRIGFNGMIEFASYLTREMKKKRNYRKPIISKFDYDETYYPILADPMCLASREMWATMWGLRGG